MKSDKRKVYLIIASVIQILIAIYVLIFAKDILRESIVQLKKSLEVLPPSLRDSFSLLTNLKLESVIFSGVLSIVTNIIIFVIAIKKDLFKNRKGIVILSILNIVFGADMINAVLSIINIIVVLSNKKEKTGVKIKKELKQEKKLKLPIPKKIEYTKKEIFFSILFLLIYLTDGLWLRYVPDFGSFYIPFLTYEALLLIFSIIIFRKKLLGDLKLFKDNFKLYIKYIFSKMWIMYLILIFVGVIVVAFTGENTTLNQEALESMPKFYIIPSAIIWAPIVEECIFRGIIRRVIKNKVLFVLVSALLFGLVHSIYEPTILKVVISGLPYAIMGGTFAYIYVKTDNMCTNIVAHAANNTIASMFSFFI